MGLPCRRNAALTEREGNGVIFLEVYPVLYVCLMALPVAVSNIS